jgi:hypothetical protein
VARTQDALEVACTQDALEVARTQDALEVARTQHALEVDALYIEPKVAATVQTHIGPKVAATVQTHIEPNVDVLVYVEDAEPSARAPGDAGGGGASRAQDHPQDDQAEELTPSTDTKPAASVVHTVVYMDTKPAASVVYMDTKPAASVVYMDTKPAASVVCNAELPSLDRLSTQYKTLADMSPQLKNRSTKRWCCTPVSRRTTTRCSTPETCSTATTRCCTPELLHYDVALRTG